MSSLATAGRRMPEIPLAFLGFLLHFLWEFVQCPLLFAGMDESGHAVMCLRATLGDVSILLFAFWGTAFASRRRRRWIVEPRAWERVTFVAIGLSVTVVFELLATRVWNRWTYSDAMPVLFGVGLAPVAQWLVIPPLVLWLVRPRLSAVFRG